ncbi:GNAT family N-acetyltransferase [Marinagarivorans cellulosilyticus]|uniref:Diamine N-acetyltransferase n=1 Tax=Marinagarivorans cellulosilyticus TaxID=2721545 RepID=A0AAN2BJ51_9GAMM|nr:GNAT family N-acetyltransferase [Marinagarivorans cellulosilyticus]BCD96574.1 diamine N-acetyltransferase [Marinagarivorans cellulosilyticus]
MLTFKTIHIKSRKICAQFREDAFICSFPNSNVWKNYWNAEKYYAWLESHIKNYPLGAIHIWLNQKIIGQLEFNYGQPLSHINLFYLRPKYRGQDYSRQMHAYTINTLRKQGTQTATLRAAPGNERAIGFYRKHGWQDLGKDAEHGEVNRYKLELTEEN